MLCALALTLAAPPSAGPPPPIDPAAAWLAAHPRRPPGPIPVDFEAADGVRIHGWYIHAGEHEDEPARHAAQPAVVLLHMYGSERQAWYPLISPFRERGIALLMIDLRGHGESSQGVAGADLAERVRQGDPELFRALWLDAAGAVDWLVDAGHRRERIGLLGAGVGGSAAIDCARRDPRLHVVGALSPGTDYLGVPTLQHLEDWGSRSLLLVTSAEQAPRGAAALRDLLQRPREDEEAALLDYWQLPQSGIHGTRMLRRVEGIESRIADWFAHMLQED